MRDKHLPLIDGDICLLPEQISSKAVNNSAKWFLDRNREIIKKELGEVNYSFDFLHKLQREYTIHNEEFSLFKKLPIKVQQFVSTQCAIMNEDPYAIVPTVPYTNIGYIILDNGIISDTIKTFRLERLFNIRQLGFMMNPTLRNLNLAFNASGFNHTRGEHSLDVVVFMRLIMMNNPEITKYKNLLSIAGVSHDALTPAGSDTTKLIDLELFDEDTHYPELFQMEEWPSLRNRYFVYEEELTEVILNKGIIGQLLDISDKLGYTSRDTWMFAGKFGLLENEFKTPGYIRIEKLLKEAPKFCNVWKDVKIKNDKMTIGGGIRLGRLLTLKTLMAVELYNNPTSRYLEYMFSKRIIKLLFNNGTITRKQLLRWNDTQLEEKIWEFLGCRYYPTHFEKSSYEKFKDGETRQIRIAELKTNNSVIAIPDDFVSVATKTGVDKFSVKRKSKIMTFREAFPEKAKEIEKIMTIESSYGLYIINFGDLNVPKNKYKYLKNMLENM